MKCGYCGLAIHALDASNCKNCGSPLTIDYRLTKVVINRRYGGFGLSDKAVRLYFQRKGWEFHSHQSAGLTHYSTTSFSEDFGKDFKPTPEGYQLICGIRRDDPDLVSVVGFLGDEANGVCAELKVVTLPNGVRVEIRGRGCTIDTTVPVGQLERFWIQDPGEIKFLDGRNVTLHRDANLTIPIGLYPLHALRLV